jgi:hypothetical protein
LNAEREESWHGGMAGIAGLRAPALLRRRLGRKRAFQVATDDAYGQLPAPNARGSYRLTDEYVTAATEDVSRQLSKAGVRLAFILNRALRKP